MGQAVIDFDTVAGRLQVRDEMQAAFIRDISHDLRSPLTRMRLALELARRQDATQPLQLDRMEHECERLDKLVAQLLWLALPCGSDQRSSVLVNLNDTVSQAVADAAFESQPKKLQILWERPARPVVVTGHSEQLNSLCENILRNALRYSPQGGAVSVALAARRGKAVLRFADRGPGVPAAALAHLFEPFFRVDPSQAAGHASLGLGLAIAGRVAFEHGGRIRAANRQGGGLRVFVELPLALMPHGASI
jgi:two-component system sensor histidine kinase CpxA